MTSISGEDATPPAPPPVALDEPAVVRPSFVAPFNRAGSPRIADLGFDAHTETQESVGAEVLAEETTADVISVPGERIGHISFGFEGERWRIRNIVWVVGQSPTGLELIDQTYRAGYRIGFDSMISTGGHLQAFTNPLDKVINLDPRATSEQLVSMLILQLSVASVAVDGLAFDATLSPPSAILTHRMAMAYAHALQLQVAFELREAATLPQKTDRDIYWKMLGRDLGRLASGYAQMAINEMALTQGSAMAGAIREFYSHARLRQTYENEVINYYRSLPSALFKDPKAMIGAFNPATSVYKLKFPGLLYAMTHEPRLNLADPVNAGASQSTVDAMAALMQVRRTAGVKDREPWQIQVATL